MGRNKGSFTATRTFLVYDDGGASLLIDEAINNSGGVSFSEQHPDILGIYANNFTIKASSSRANTWEVAWSYAQPMTDVEAGGLIDPFFGDTNNTSLNPTQEEINALVEQNENQTDGGGEDDNDTLPTGIQGYSMTVGVAIIDIWKSNPSIPSIGTEHSGDIGGTLVAEGGEPISMVLPTADISIRVTTEQLLSGGHLVGVVGKRNSGAWQGFPAGSVLFTGANVTNSLNSVNEIEYSLAFDLWHHMRQAPERDDSGEVVIDSTTGAVEVYLKQPFPETVSFSFLPM